MSQSYGTGGEFSAQGIWSTSVDHKKILPGTVWYSFRGDRWLDLLGRMPVAAERRENSIQAIYGTLTDGSRVTLANAYETNYTRSEPGLVTSRLSFGVAAIGDEYVDFESDKFESAKVEFNGLQAWSGGDVIDTFWDLADGSKDKDKLYTIFRASVTSISATVKMTREFTKRRTVGSLVLTQSDNLVIRPREKQDIAWYVDVISQLQRFFTFVIGKPLGVKYFGVSKGKKKLSKVNGYVSKYISFIYPNSHMDSSPEIGLSDVTIPFADIDSVLPRILTGWFERRATSEVLAGLTFGLFVSGRTPETFKFLALVQGLESYFDRTSSGCYMSEDEFKEMRNRIWESIPVDIEESHRVALMNRVRYGYQYSLRKKLKNMLEEIPDAIKKEIIKDVSSFSGRIVDTRNQLTHQSSKAGIRAMDFGDMCDACDDLMCLIRYILLRDSGLSDKILVKGILADYRKLRPICRARIMP